MKVTDEFWIGAPPRLEEDLILLADQKIRYVINAADYDNAAFLSDHGFVPYIARGFVDNGRQQSALVWEGLWTFIEQALALGDGVIFSHCVGGPRRSVSVAYLFLRLKGVEDAPALDFLRLLFPSQEPIYAGYIRDWIDARDAGGAVAIAFS